MLQHTIPAKPWALPALACFHILVIASSNYLVQIPIQVSFVTVTWGTFTFPFVYLATDLTVRVFGASLARKIIATVMLPALVLSYMVSVLFQKGEFTGWHALGAFNMAVARIAIASFSAYVIGQLMDVLVFNRLRRSPRWWLAPGASTIFGNMIDSISFFSIAFYHSSNTFMAEHWVSIGIADYAYKLLVCFVLILPFYGVLLSYLSNKLSKAQSTEGNPEYDS